MKIHDFKSQFGWEGDEGIGEMLIQQIIRGKKTATGAPKELYSSEELHELHRSIGAPATVVDKHGKPRCNIRMLAVFETTFGHPDQRLVRGEGFEDPEAYRTAHREAWRDLIETGKLILTNETVIVVELFELEREAGP